MTTERLEEFRVLATILNYSRAAEKLFISQSILSRHISELESDLGTQLFIRNRHSVQLTEDGKFLLKYIEPLLGKTETVISKLSDERIGAEGSLSITCAEQTLSTRIIDFLRNFQDRYPEIRMMVSPLSTADRHRLIYSCDVLLSISDFTDLLSNDIEAAFLCDQQPLVAIPPMHHIGDLQEVSLDQLRGETIIVPSADKLTDPYIRNFMLANRKCHGTLHRLTATGTDAALLMVELGYGLMLIPHHLKQRVYPHTRTVTITDPECRFSIFAYRNKVNENRAAELFFEQLCKEFHPGK